MTVSGGSVRRRTRSRADGLRQCASGGDVALADGLPSGLDGLALLAGIAHPPGQGRLAHIYKNIFKLF